MSKLKPEVKQMNALRRAIVKKIMRSDIRSYSVDVDYDTIQSAHSWQPFMVFKGETLKLYLSPKRKEVKRPVGRPRKPKPTKIVDEAEDYRWED